MTRLYRLGASEGDPSPPLRNGASCPHSLGASGGPLISSGGIVSREWAVIQSAASSLEINSPKWCTVPFGHTICTRQMLPLRAGNKTVQCVCVSMKLKYAPLDETDKPFWLSAAPMPAPRRFPPPGSFEEQAACSMIAIWRAIYETKARCRHFRFCNTGACSRATRSAAKRTEANEGGCSKRRPDRHER